MSSIMQYNGAAVITMAGKKCVGIASDRRYGLRNQTISCEMQKTFKVNDRTLCGLTGLATDMQTLEQRFVFRSNMYRLREEVRNKKRCERRNSLQLSLPNPALSPDAPLSLRFSPLLPARHVAHRLLQHGL